jgi:hypothetical protein
MEVVNNVTMLVHHPTGAALIRERSTAPWSTCW